MDFNNLSKSELIHVLERVNIRCPISDADLMWARKETFENKADELRRRAGQMALKHSPSAQDVAIALMGEATHYENLANELGSEIMAFRRKQVIEGVRKSKENQDER